MNKTFSEEGPRIACENCLFFHKTTGKVGQCRRHAPIKVGFPVNYIDDWCGDYIVPPRTELSE